MGRDWYWGGGRNSKNGGKTEDKDSLSSNSTGCMCSVFQIFDFQFPNLTQNPQPPSSSSSLTLDSLIPDDPPAKGNEAPRNSLELDTPPLLTTVTPDQCLYIPMGIQVKTNGSQNESCSSEISSSPSTKTPNLVARLMGLDILPDQCHSPTSTLTTPTPARKSHRRQSLHTKTGGTRSLPETPRISSARKSDVEHRLSLQINKENVGFSPGEELKRRDLRIRTATDEENKSPGHYARQIVKQVKESVGRRVGSDITNTVKSRNDIPVTTQFKSKKITATQLDYCDCSDSNSRIRFSNKEQNGVVLGRPRLQHHRPKMAEERLGPKKPPQTSEIIRNKREKEPFVRSTSTTATKIPDKKCKKSPLSNDAVPTILPIKKDPIPPATKIPQKQALPNVAQESKRSAQLSSCPSHSYKQQETIHTTTTTRPDSQCKTQYNSNRVVSAIAGVQQEQEEFEYITRILKRTGIDKNTPVSFTRWFSPSHPIDPSIFHSLEFFTPKKPEISQLSHRCNRKLIFQLADEILAGILKPYMNIKPWTNSPISNLKGDDLINVLCSKIRSFPSADCRVLEDIDALIDKDFPPLKEQSELAFGEEGEGIVMEVEKELLDSLVHETTMVLYGK